MRDSTGEEGVRAAHQAALVGGTPLEQVPDIPDGEPFALEWKTFRSLAHRLVQEGHLGRFALIKGERLVNVWDTLRDADQAGRERFGPEPFLVQEIQLFLRPQRWGYCRPCRD